MQYNTPHTLYAFGRALRLQVEAEGVLNLALRVRQDLSGCESSGSTGYALWFLALQALKRTGQTLDLASMDRLFARDNRQVSAPLFPSTNPKPQTYW